MTAPEISPEEADREIEHSSTERLVFFSDAVTAIALTLLALELPVPQGETSREVLREVREHLNSYLAFVISFLVIASHWRAHHDVFRYVRAVTPRLTQLNFGWLLLIVITPFTTQVLSEGDQNLARFATYGLTQALQFGLFAIMVSLLIKHRLLMDPADKVHLHVPIRRSLVFACTFGGSVPLYPLLGTWTFALWFFLPLLSNAVRHLINRQKDASVGRTTR